MKVHDARDGFHDLKPEMLSGMAIPWILIFLILLAVFAFFIFRKKKFSKDKGPISKTLLEFANELKRLKESAQLGKENFNLITAKVSLLVRGYFVDRYRIPVIESTPQEVLDQLITSNILSSERSDEIFKILSQLEVISFSEEKQETEFIKSRVIQLIEQANVLLDKIESNIPRKVI